MVIRIMKNVKTPIKLILYLAFLMVQIGCGSKGAILYSPETVDKINDYIKETSELVNGGSADKLEVVFHQAGSFQEYAKNINTDRFNYSWCPSSTKDVSCLMDRSFKKLQADGIEMDVQTIPGSDIYKNVYIVHDEIDEADLSKMAKAYLENNSLKQVLSHFIEQKYFRDNPAGKHLFLELKIPKKLLHVNHSPLNSKQKKYIEQIIIEMQEAIESAASDRNESAAIRRHIGFASFNLYALEYAHAFSTQKMQDGYSFNFIAGTNRGFLGYVVNVFFSNAINYLDAELKKKLISHNWLTGIWFDPAGIDGIAKTFNSINKEREEPLSIYISTYKLRRGDYFRLLRKDMIETADGEMIKLENVRGLFFDIQACQEE